MKQQILHRTGLLTLISISMVVAASCQAHDEIEPQKDNLVNLIPQVDTKGAPLTTANLTEFISFGYAQNYAQWADVSATATSNLMFNNKYTKVANAWVGETQTQWPDNTFKRYSFFAYSPAASAANKITLLTTQSSVGYQKLSYQTLTTIANQVDLVLADRLDQTPSNVVPLSFGHALSRVGFCAYAEKTGVTIKSIAINGIQYKGEIEVRRNATWSNVSTDKTNFGTVINSAALSTDVNNPTSLIGANGENYFMILPQNLTHNKDETTNITIVTTKDGKDRTLRFTIANNFEQGKSLLYKLYINDLADVVYSYTVTDWTANTIPTPINATYLNVTMSGANSPSVIFYATDYTGAITYTDLNNTGKLTFVHDAAKKSITATASTPGTYKVKITAGNLSKEVDVVYPLLVTSNVPSDVTYMTSVYVFKVSSAYNWVATSGLSWVTFSPSSGGPGTDIQVLMTIGPNRTQSPMGFVATFVNTEGTYGGRSSFSVSQAANPDVYLGRFGGTIMTIKDDQNITYYYYNTQLFASTTDEAGTFSWATAAALTGVNSMVDGKYNTSMLSGVNYPALNKCYTKAGDKWFVPAKYQQLPLYIVKPALTGFNDSTPYWSSSETSDNNAWAITMGNGSFSEINKLSAKYVRCIRQE